MCTLLIFIHFPLRLRLLPVRLITEHPPSILRRSSSSVASASVCLKSRSVAQTHTRLFCAYKRINFYAMQDVSSSPLIPAILCLKASYLLVKSCGVQPRSDHRQRLLGLIVWHHVSGTPDLEHLFRSSISAHLSINSLNSRSGCRRS